jgi:DNA (cytosine-5)-methyltransferase 1
MKYLSVCSGIEAASVAWAPLGWNPVAFSEIGDFQSHLLAHHYPDTPNWGDMTKFKEWPDANVDVLVGGTPCQSFSLTGLRSGLDDPRGNLALVYLAIADRYRPKWIIWENVPGVLSSGQGRDFGAFLGGLGQLGYGFAYRVLDAQYVRADGFENAVAQRRRRVFVIGHLGDWRLAAASLFEPGCLSENHSASRAAWSGHSRAHLAGADQTIYSLEPHVDRPDGLMPNIAYTLRSQRRPVIISNSGARRFSTVECERLQGFPDGYTDIDGYSASDRYEAIGNSMAVNCMRWIGQRINGVGA